MNKELKIEMEITTIEGEWEIQETKVKIKGVKEIIQEKITMKQKNHQEEMAIKEKDQEEVILEKDIKEEENLVLVIVMVGIKEEEEGIHLVDLQD